MKVITIGTDEKLFEEGSAVQLRQIAYAAKMEESHVVVCTLNKTLYPQRIGNLFIYPALSKNKLHYVFDAYSRAKRVMIDNTFVRGTSIVSAQDTGECGLTAYLLSRRFRFPLQLQIHTDVFNPYFRYTFLNKVRVVLAWLLIPRATGVRVVSSTIVASLHHHFPHMKTRITLLPIFVDISEIGKTLPKKDLKKEFPQFNFIVFMASRLTKEKNIDTALYALKQVVSVYPRVGLVIAGSGPERNRLEILSSFLGISRNVLFIGWQDDLISYYKTANIFLSTSLYEGYGMSLIEAGACGCSIISTPVGIAKDILKDGENGFVCPVGDILRVVAGIERLLSDNALRELFKLHIQDSIHTLAIPWEQHITDYVKSLEKLL